MKESPSYDLVILACVLLLSGFGMAVTASVAPDLLASQLAFYAMGVILLLLFSRIDCRIYQSLGKLVYFVSLILLLVTLVIGIESRGAVRWISVGPLRLQFSELIKPFLVCSVASFLAASKKIDLRRFMILIAITIFPSLLVFKQPDLGSAVVYLLTFMGMIFVSGAGLGYFVLVLSGLGLSLPLLWQLLAPYQRMRLLSFIAPHYDPLGSSYNAIQAVITVGSGMIFGQGLGRGTQTHLLFLPERHTDFAFSSVAEELGLVGAGTLLVLYFVILWRILKAAERTNRYGKLILSGLGLLIFSQVFMNVGMNLGLLPVTGITLPFVSYGGSSVLSTMIAIGIVENVIKETGLSDSPDIV